MDEDSRKNTRIINNMSKNNDDDKMMRHPDEVEYEQVEIWSEEWQCNILGLARKRDRSRSRSRGGDDEEERPASLLEKRVDAASVF